MSKVKRFSLEERYGYQNRKVIYDKNADNDIELNNIYPIIDLLNQLDQQIADLQLKQQIAEKDEEIEELNDKLKWKSKWLKTVDNMVGHYEKSNQDKISFAVDILEELADCSNYINSKLDFECGFYVSEKSIRDKIKYLKGKKDE